VDQLRILLGRLSLIRSLNLEYRDATIHRNVGDREPNDIMSKIRRPWPLYTVHYTWIFKKEMNCIK